MQGISHINDSGKAQMVDVSEKHETLRTAEAMALVKMSESAISAVKSNMVTKGDVLSVAKIAGIQAAKRTSDLIPLCHNIFISHIDISFELIDEENSIFIKSFAKTTAPTGIEMEALTAVSVAALAVYDMCKAIDKSIIITGIKLLSKTGGKSGDYKNSEVRSKNSEVRIQKSEVRIKNLEVRIQKSK